MGIKKVPKISDGGVANPTAFVARHGDDAVEVSILRHHQKLTLLDKTLQHEGETPSRTNRR